MNKDNDNLVIGDGTFHIAGFFGEYRWLSNFWPCVVSYDGHAFKTVEQAYQYAKADNEGDKSMMLSATNPKQPKYFSHLINGRKRKDWEEVKLSIMEDLVRQKFTNNDKLKQMLLNTRGCYITEDNTWGDVFWGVCKGVGENHLGKIIMKVRSELKNEEKSKKVP